MKTLLAIDSGGLFGVGVANWIPKLGNFKFDYYAGISVGSILATCYAFGMEPEKVRESFNSDFPQRLFVKPGFPQCLNPLRAAVYSNKGAKELLKEVFGDAKVKDAKYPLIIVAWNYEKRKEKIFTRKFNGDYLVRDAILASISAPTYFPFAIIKNEKQVSEKLGDGVVCGNDSSLAGMAAMKDDGIKTTDIKCLSIGPIGMQKEKKVDVYTKSDWVPVIVDIITLGNASYNSYAARRLLDDSTDNKKFLRITPNTLPQCYLDDFSMLSKIKEAWEAWDHLEAVSFLMG